MNFGELALRNRTVTLVFAFMLLVGGWFSYKGLGRLEDPEFTIKDAQIVTHYPGATAAEVESEVTDRIEQAAQRLAQVEYVRSNSMPGVSIVKVTIKDQYDKFLLPQVWDELRRKVGDVQSQLPPGTSTSIVNDDFGAVYGVFIAISGPEYSSADLEEFGKVLRRELLLVQDVARIDLIGVQQEVVFVEMTNEAKLQTGLSPAHLGQVLQAKTLAADGGSVEVGPSFVTIQPTGGVTQVSDYESILVENPKSGALVRLGDIATIRRAYADPPQMLLRVDGERAIGLAISTVPGGNVVEMGEALELRTKELDYLRPLGVEYGVIALQPEAVVASIDGFIINLVEAVAIVIVILLIFMGARSGFLIGIVLILTIAGTFILMAMFGVALERISLGALVIALGMLVDNAIVITDGVRVGLDKGQKAEDSAIAIVKQTALPLLIATVIAILSFAAIGTSDDSTGEYCGSLFQVLMYSLGLSWVTAVTITPVLCVMMLKPPAKPTTEDVDGKLLRGYKVLLAKLIRWRFMTILVTVGALVASVIGFGSVKQSFFPDSTRPQFMVDYFAPRGTHIEDTEAQIAEIEAWIGEQEGVTQVASTVGQGAPRFLLTYAPEEPDTGYGQLFISVEDYRQIPELQAKIQTELETRFIDGAGNTKLFMLGPGEGGKMQVRISGADNNQLRMLSRDVITMFEDAGARGVRSDWRDRVEVLRPILAEEPARLAGIDRQAVAEAIAGTFEGRSIGVYREGDRLLPLVLRSPERERADIAMLENTLIWSPTARSWIPLRQVLAGVETGMTDDLVRRRNRIRTVTVHADPAIGTLASETLDVVIPQLEAMDLPPGYEIEMGGEYENSGDAREAMAGSVVLFGILMILMTILLFNGLKQPLVIWLCVPLSLIGVTLGLLSTGNPFGFMATLGLLSLVGMLIKNAIVLLDEIDLQVQTKPRMIAFLDASASRIMPVSMAALTTMLGMIPLFTDAFFVAMAVTIVFGLGVATILTLLIVPVLYATVMRVKDTER